jgi:hypothetical protein
MKNRKIWIGVVLTLLCTLLMGVSVFAADATMKNKKWITGTGGVYEDTDKDGMVDDLKSYGKVYYKIKVPKKGYIIVNTKTYKLPKEDEYYSYLENVLNFDEGQNNYTRVTLLNSSKKEMESFDNYDENGKKDIVFSVAVKKGTYYLAVESEQKYKIRYAFTAVGKLSKKGKWLDSAPTLKKGVTAKNLLFYNELMHAYKINLPQKSKINISVQSKLKGGDFTGSLNVQLYVKKGKKYKGINEKGKLLSDDEASWWEIEGRDKITVTLPKGTYYIKFFSAETSGYYTFRWK